MRIWFVWLSLLALFHAGVAAASPSFDIVVASDFAGANVSADGSTVTWGAADLQGYAGIYDVATGQSTMILVGPNGVSTPAVSADGSVVQGTYFDGMGRNLYEFTNGTTLNDIGLSDLSPQALSDDGTVWVGFQGSSSSPVAVRTTGGVNGTSIVLGDLAGGGTESIAWDVSGDGSIAVGRGSSASGDEAFRWEAGTLTGLGDLAGGGFGSEAFGISQDGSTIVGSGTSAAGQEAFRWSGGTMTGLGDLAGGDFSSVAYAASGDGSVVVGASAVDGDILTGDDSAAFLWDETHGMRDLQDFLTSLGLDLSALVLREATDISSDGRTIVGNGINLDTGQAIAWVAIIPEPSTFGLVAAGLAVLGARRRVRRVASTAGVGPT